MVWLVACATLVGSALTAEETGITTTLGAIVIPILGGLGHFGFLLALTIIILVSTNLFNNLAVKMLVLAICGSLIAGGLDLSGAAIGGLVLITFTLGLLLPGSSIFGALLHTAEMVTPVSIYKNVILAMLYVIFITAIVYIPLAMFVY